MSDKKVKNIFSYVLFGVVCLLALSNSIHITEYISNIARAAIVPLLLIGIIDFLGKVYDKAKLILEEKSIKAQAEYSAAKTVCDSVTGQTGNEAHKLYEYWNEQMEQKIRIAGERYILSLEIDRLYKWYLPVYVLLLIFLIISMLLAQSEDWLSILARFNSDTITLWTFTLLLLDITFTETFANGLVNVVEKKYNEKRKI